MVALFVSIALGLGLGVMQLAQGVLLLVSAPALKGSMMLLARYLYSTRVGYVHVWAFRLVRRCWANGKPHSRSLRVNIPVPLGGGGGGGGAADEGGAPTAVGVGHCTVHTVATLLDNYAYLIVDGATRRAGVVDPVDPDLVLRALRDVSDRHYGSAPLELEAILTTHKHWDHAGGNVELRRKCPSVTRVYGGVQDAVAGMTHPVVDGDVVRIGSLRIRAMHTPCHTKGHICYLLQGVDGRDALFSGDTLFCGGCGAPFEGGPEEMRNNFARIWAACDEHTLLFPGHEYSEHLLYEYFGGAYSAPWRPRGYAALCNALFRARDRRYYSQPSAPVLLSDELHINTNFNPLHDAADVLAHAWRQRETARANRATRVAEPDAARLRRRCDGSEVRPAALRRPAALGSIRDDASVELGGIELTQTPDAPSSRPRPADKARRPPRKHARRGGTDRAGRGRSAAGDPSGRRWRGRRRLGGRSDPRRWRRRRRVRSASEAARGATPAETARGGPEYDEVREANRDDEARVARGRSGVHRRSFCGLQARFRRAGQHRGRRDLHGAHPGVVAAARGDARSRGVRQSAPHGVALRRRKGARAARAGCAAKRTTRSPGLRRCGRVQGRWGCIRTR